MEGGYACPVLAVVRIEFCIALKLRSRSKAIKNEMLNHDPDEIKAEEKRD